MGLSIQQPESGVVFSDLLLKLRNLVLKGSHPPLVLRSRRVPLLEFGALPEQIADARKLFPDISLRRSHSRRER